MRNTKLGYVLSLEINSLYYTLVIHFFNYLDNNRIVLSNDDTIEILKCM